MSEPRLALLAHAQGIWQCAFAAQTLENAKALPIETQYRLVVAHTSQGSANIYTGVSAVASAHQFVRDTNCASELFSPKL